MLYILVSFNLYTSCLCPLSFHQIQMRFLHALQFLQSSSSMWFTFVIIIVYVPVPFAFFLYQRGSQFELHAVLSFQISICIYSFIGLKALVFSWNMQSAQCCSFLRFHQMAHLNCDPVSPLIPPILFCTSIYTHVR